MWIKTAEGALVNCDRMEYLCYVKSLDVTHAYVDGSRVTISDGDVTERVISGLLTGVKVLEVGKHG